MTIKDFVIPASQIFSLSSIIVNWISLGFLTAGQQTEQTIVRLTRNENNS